MVEWRRANRRPRTSAAGSGWHDRAILVEEPLRERIGAQERRRNVRERNERRIEAFRLVGVGSTGQLDVPDDRRPFTETCRGPHRCRQIGIDGRRREAGCHSVRHELRIDEVDHTLVVAGIGEKREERVERAGIGEQALCFEPAGDSLQQCGQRHGVVREWRSQVPRERLVIDADAALRGSLDQYRRELLERAVDAMGGVRPDLAELGPGHREVGEGDDVGDPPRVRVEGPIEMVVVALQGPVEWRELENDRGGVDTRLRRSHRLAAQVRRVEGIAARSLGEDVDERSDGLVLFKQGRRRARRFVAGWNEAEPAREQLDLRLREARERDGGGTGLVKCSEVTPRLAEDDERHSRREVERRERLRHAVRWIERAPHPGPDARDVVDAVDDERDPAIGLQLERAAERVHQRVLVRCEAWSLIVDESRVLRREATEKAAENRFGEHALEPLAIGVAQIAVVLRD